MGCGHSHPLVPGVKAAFPRTIDVLGLEPYLEQLCETYFEIDQQHSGSIDIIELLDHLQYDRTPFAERLFQYFDENQRGDLDWRETVFGLWVLGTADEDGLRGLVWEVYSKDNVLADNSVLLQILHDMYGEKGMSSPFASQLVARCKGVKAAPIRRGQFNEFVAKHKTFLFPLDNLAKAVHKRVLSGGLWKKLTAARRRTAVKNQLFQHGNAGKLYQMIKRQDIQTKQRRSAKGGGKVTPSAAGGKTPPASRLAQSTSSVAADE
jgi:hypothetical protein